MIGLFEYRSPTRCGKLKMQAPNTAMTKERFISILRRLNAFERAILRFHSRGGFSSARNAVASPAVCVKWTGIVERVDFLQFTIEHTDAIKHVIDSIGSLHVKNSCDIVSFDDVLPDLNILNCREDHRQKANHDLSSA